MVRVKICGITNLEDALSAIDSGAEALGFVFYKKSPRYIAPRKVREITKQLPKNIFKVGVFVNAREKSIKDIAKTCCLDILQFHGHEPPEFCRKFKAYKIIKAFRIRERIDFKKIAGYKVFAYLFDTFSKAKIGATGKTFNWKLLKGVDKLRRPIFLSGGLNKDNVRQAIRRLYPDWVDVSSSIEICPGKKDHQKAKEFIEMVKVKRGEHVAG